MSTTDQIIVLGAGSFAREVIHLFQDKRIKIVVVDDKFISNNETNRSIYPISMFSFTPRLFTYAFNLRFICAIISPKRNKIISEFTGYGFIPSDAFVHDTAYLAPSALAFAGSIICPQVSITSNSEIGNHVIVNRGAQIGHNVYIEQYSTIGPGVNIAGGVHIGQGTFIGMGTNILENIQIGAGVTVGAGALVNKNIPDGETWWGVPARKIDGR